MENKYYTPTLEEFHVGFEFELYGSIGHIGLPRKDSVPGWYQCKIDTTEDYFMYNSFPIETIRVKYLDRGDIESLGFVNAINSFATAQKAVLTGEIAMFYTKDNIVIVFNYKTTDMLPADYYITISIDKKIVFDGTIKNKSELVKLLKMLGIC